MNLKFFFSELKRNEIDLIFYDIFKMIKENSNLLSSILDLNKIEPLSRQKHNNYLDVLLSNNVENYFDFIQYIINSESDFKYAVDAIKFYKIKEEINSSYLFKYGYSIKLNNSTSIIGREEEVKICHVLLNRNYKNNLIIIGETGVGKTAIIAEIASKFEIDIVCIEINSVISGTKHRGDFEERLTKIIEDSIKFEKIIFIDEIHVLMNCSDSDGSISATNILKPYLTNRKFRLIGATTTEESKKIINDKSFERRFNFFKIPEPSENILIKIIRENFSEINSNIDEEIIFKLFDFLNGIKNRYYPDKLIDFLDLWNSYNKSEKTIVDLNKAINLYLLCSNI